MQCPKCGGSNIIKRGKQAYGNNKPRWSCGRGYTKKPIGGCGWHGNNPVGLEQAESEGVPRAEADKLHRKMRQAAGVQRYVITAAQNATPVHEPFLASLRHYCEVTGAQLVVIPYRYKNPTSRWSERLQSDDWWAPELVKSIMDKRVHLNDNLTLLADIKTQPTAGAPLQGFETISGGRSAIVGHPKLELLTIATPQQRLPKILTTTGAVTRPNYIQSKAGKKGEHHHTLGACVAEVHGKLFHLRQIVAMPDGSFCDLDSEYDGDKVRTIRPAGLVMGDTHVDFVDPTVVEATFGAKGLVTVLRPEKLVWHDVLDSYAGSHHHGVFQKYAKHHARRANVEQELDRCCAFIDEHGARTMNIVVSSNHHNHLARWVRETDPRQDPENAVFWAQTFAAMCQGTTLGASGTETPDPFVYWASRKIRTAKVRFLRGDESHRICGIEVGMHGDAGPNGSRGAIGAFGKIGVKSVIGHTHTPGIKDGVYQVGTSSRLGLEYTHGPSSWLHTHCVIYPNGKRSLVNIIEGRWRV